MKKHGALQKKEVVMIYWTLLANIYSFAWRRSSIYYIIVGFIKNIFIFTSLFKTFPLERSCYLNLRHLLSLKLQIRGSQWGSNSLVIIKTSLLTTALRQGFHFIRVILQLFVPIFPPTPFFPIYFLVNILFPLLIFVFFICSSFFPPSLAMSSLTQINPSSF